MRLLVTIVSLPLLLTACGRSEAFPLPRHCLRQQNGTPPLPLSTSGALTLAWNPDVCVPITMAGSVSRRAELEKALAAWSAMSCTALCFERPTVREDAPTETTDRRIHAAFDFNSHNEWALAYDPVTGEILHGVMWLNNDSTQGDVLKQLGQVLGFVPLPTVDSTITRVDAHSSATELTTADQKSVCAAYPACIH
jgi:hypothetical protein